MDQVPLPFFHDNNRTLNPKNSGKQFNRVAQQGNGSLSKRMATLQLCIRAGGGQIIKPWLIFRTQGTRLTAEEIALYATLTNIGITFQPKAWADERISLLWLEYFREQTLDLGEVLLGADNHAPQSTPACRAFMKMFDIVPAWTPTECTDVVSPVDKNVGKYFQTRMAQKWKEHADAKKAERLEEGNPESDSDSEDSDDEYSQSITVPQRRMLMAKWLSEVWSEFTSGTDTSTVDTLIVPAFIKTGFLLAMDGSENHLVEMDGWVGEPGGYTF